MSIEAIRKAKEILERGGTFSTRCHQALEVLDKALAQPEQEPVAWLCESNDYGIWKSSVVLNKIDSPALRNFVPLYGTPPKREHLERLCRIMGTFDLATGHADTMEQALDALESELRDVLGYLRAKRSWVGLTEDELNMLGDSMRTWNSHSLTDVYVAIEAKLKEKNT